jgi:large subunit ribosomal protein L28
MLNQHNNNLFSKAETLKVMARRCNLSGKAVLVGNKVSHSNRKAKKRFLPNLQNVTLLSDMLGCKIRTRITPHALRSVEINGGIDSYLLTTKDCELSPEILSFKRRLKKVLAEQTEQ